jgi:hypothetical protein
MQRIIQPRAMREVGSLALFPWRVELFAGRTTPAMDKAFRPCPTSSSDFRNCS